MEAPRYPSVAGLARIYGVVTADLSVDPNGTVAAVEILRGANWLLDRGVVEAAGQWRFVGGPGRFLVTVTFQLWDDGPEACVPGAILDQSGLVQVFVFLTLNDVMHAS